jgi:hypothetical protein
MLAFRDHAAYVTALNQGCFLAGCWPFNDMLTWLIMLAAKHDAITMMVHGT